MSLIISYEIIEFVCVHRLYFLDDTDHFSVPAMAAVLVWTLKQNKFISRNQKLCSSPVKHVPSAVVVFSQ